MGTVRKVNEDACLERPEIGLWVVADGMGGHQAGDVASNMIVDVLRDMPPATSSDDFVAETRSRVQDVNRRLQDYAEQHAPGGIIGSTVAVFGTFGARSVCLWVGDSRVYRLRDEELRQLTRDHSHVEELISLGMLRREDAASHPDGNIVTRAVGAAPELAIDVVAGDLRGDDSYLICSDGLTGVLSDKEIADMMLSGDCEDSVRALLHLALIRGARDNVTLVIVEIEEKGR